MSSTEGLTNTPPLVTTTSPSNTTNAPSISPSNTNIPYTQTTPPVQITYNPIVQKDENNQVCGFDIVPNTYIKNAFEAIGAYDISNAYTNVQNEIKRRQDYINRIDSKTGSETISFHQAIVDKLQIVSKDLLSDTPLPSEDMDILCNLQLKK
jgi:hypothetical protein